MGTPGNHVTNSLLFLILRFQYLLLYILSKNFFQKSVYILENIYKSNQNPFHSLVITVMPLSLVSSCLANLPPRISSLEELTDCSLTT